MHILTKSKQRIKSIALGGSAFVLLAVPSTALAHGGGGDNGRNGSSNRQVSAAQDKHHDNNWNKWWRDKQDRHKTCEQRQADLNAKAASYQKRYTKQLNVLNIVYSGIQTEVSNGNVTIDNYDALKTQADTDQAAATPAVNAIAAPQLSCDDDSNSQSQLDSDSNSKSNSFNDSVKAAQDAVSVYKRDVMNLLNAAVNG